MLVTRAGSVCDAHVEEEDACNPRRHACSSYFAVPAAPVATTRLPAAHVFPCLRGIPVAVGASGPENLFFFIASSKTDN